MTEDRTDDPLDESDSRVPDPDTSASWQDGSSADVAGWEGPKDLGSTSEGSGLTAGGTDTAIGSGNDVTKGGMAGSYGGGYVTGGVSSGEIGTVGDDLPPPPQKPEDED